MVGAPIPALTAALVARGPAEPLLATLRSLTGQTELPCEILVLDDGVEDAALVEAAVHADPRARILRNVPALGDPGCLQRAIAEARAPLLTVLHPGEVLMRGALDAMYHAMDESPEIGVAHCWWFPLGEPGGFSESAFEAHRERLQAFLPAGLDHRLAMLAHGNIVQALPTIRQDCLRGQDVLAGVTLDDAMHRVFLRILNRAEGRIVPRLLCGRPTDGRRKGELPGPRRYLRHLARYLQAEREGPAGSLRQPRARFVRLVAFGFLWSLASGISPSGSRRIFVATKRWWRARRKPRAASGAGYRLFVALLQRWSLGSLLPSRRHPRTVNGARVAYVRLAYPTRTATFVRREIMALREAGVDLEVFALESRPHLTTPDPASPAGPVTYFDQAESDQGKATVAGLLRSKRWTALRLRLFVARHRYRIDKTWQRDRGLFELGLQLAAALAQRGITHVHAPVADRAAVLCLVASRLLGITLSVQARASEIHRTVEADGAADRLRVADFVITNSRYNERYLRTRLGPGAPPIHTIYNGLDLNRFTPRSESAPAAGALRILAVGRLVEPKGFRYLLLAVRLLRDRGIACTCEIIGGPQEPLDGVTWLELRLLHDELELGEWIRFRGEQPFAEVLLAYRRADVFALPCVTARDGSHDITPNSLIEAMAMGLPVVSTTSGAIPEIVAHESSGLLIRPNDERALADALERLASDAALRERLGAAARRTVEERFDVARNVTARLRLFRPSATA